MPYLWIAREPGRFIYLTHFAMAVLAGFGARTLFATALDTGIIRKVGAPVKWIAIAVAAIGFAATLLGSKQPNEWVFISLLFIAASWALLEYLSRGRSLRTASVLALMLIVLDLGSFRWGLHDKAQAAREGWNHFDRLLNSRGMAEFLKAQPGLFRVTVEGEWAPNIGNLYGIQTLGSMAATTLKDFEIFVRHLEDRALDLLNVRYVARPKPQGEERPVYADAEWHVYERKSPAPRAWVVHRVEVESQPSEVISRLKKADFDTETMAVVDRPVTVHPAAQPSTAAVRVYRAHRIEVDVDASATGLLVLSEIYYPGWRAYVNERATQIHKVNGLLRGIEVPEGTSRVVLRYAPMSAMVGALLSALGFVSVAVFAVVLRWQRRHRSSEEVVTARAPAL